MNEHNYGADDYPEYSKDPEWQRLHREAYPERYGTTTTDTTVDTNERGYSTVAASEINGVDSSGDHFWEHHTNSKEAYMQLASKLPEVQEQLAQGISLDEIKQNPDLRDCASAYYDTDKMVKVEQTENGYEFQDDGRHRVAAAQELGYNIPVNIINSEKQTSSAIPTLTENADTDTEEISSEDIYFEGTANENFEYGGGGGKQYFIPNANEMKEDGRLKEIGKLNGIYDANESSRGYKSFQSENGKTTYEIDDRPLSDAEKTELEDLEQNTPENISDSLDYSLNDEEISEEEIRQLDENTMDESGLNKANTDQQEEDYIHPHANQEDTNGEFFPDAWSNSQKMHDGDILFQVSKDGDTKSSYFTDQETIDSCMRDDGTVDMNKLSDKLQIKDGQEKLSIKKYRYSSSSEAQVSDIPEDKRTVNTADDNFSGEPDWERTSLKPSEEAILRELEENGEIDVQLSGENGDEPKQGDLHLPTEKTGSFLGEKGNSEFMPNSKIALEKMGEYGKNTVEYKDGYPDFSPFTEHNTEYGKLKCEVEISHMTDQRENPSWEYGRRPRGTAHNPNNDLGNFAQADNALLLKMQELNPNATVNDVVQFRKDNQLTWHECADGKTMQLVPQAIHDACRHSGGVSEMKYRMAWGSYYND